MTIRLAAVFSHPIQYFAPLFQLLAADPELDFLVLYCTDWGVRDYHDRDFDESVRWDLPLLEGYSWEFLPPRKPLREMTFFSIDNPAVGARLDAFRADVVWIHGYAYATNLRALWWGRNHGVVMTGDSELLHQRSAVRRAVKRVILPRIFNRVDVFVDYGERNREYYRHYGVPPEKMVPGGYPLDVARFQAGREGFAAGDERELRSRFGLRPQVPTITWVGKLIPAKRPLDLVRAVSLLAAEGRDVQALFVGSGPLRPELERLVEKEGLQGKVRFAGFINQSEMPRVLCLGDILVMSSEKEPYGLAIPEAMAVGNAIVASDRVGCVSATGVARPEVNTLVYPCGDAAGLAGALERLLADRALLQSMREASRRLAWLQDRSVIAEALRTAARRAHEMQVAKRPCAA